MPRGFELAIWVVLTISSITDLRSGKVYNVITFPFLIFGLLFQLYFGGVSGLGQASFAVGTAFVLFFPLYLMRAFAAGDVKLLMAVGAWCDAKSVVYLAALSILIGSFVGFLELLRARGVAGSLGSMVLHFRSRPGEVKSLRMPFAPGFLCAYCILRIAELRQWQLL